MYDIFISYRRENGAQYARILQLILQQKGYNVFLDYEELTDGIWGKYIKKAISEASIFILILSPNALDRCVNKNDWLRQEILLSIQEKKHIIPVNPDGTFDGLANIKDLKDIPNEILHIVSEYQHSEIRFGQTLGATVDLMIKNRIIPIIGNRKPLSKFNIIIKRALSNTNKIIWLKNFIILTLSILLFILGIKIYKDYGTSSKNEYQENLTNTLTERTNLHEKYRNFDLFLSPNLSTLQIRIIDEILQNMSEVKKDKLWMSQFEFSKKQWYGIRNILYEEEDCDLPITNISYGEIYLLLGQLSDMTNLDISLPSVEEWEYAAKGGLFNENTLYVGNNIATSVAWYRDNSGGIVHPSNGQQGMEPNMLDLYDMSGNVSELCNTLYENNPDIYTICGGNFASPITDITTTSQAPFHIDAQDPTVGFRIVIHCNFDK